MQKRPNAVTFKGTPHTLVGPQLKVGDTAPDFACLQVLDKVTLASTPAKARLFSVVPSLDTPVCSMQTKKFEEATSALKDKVGCYTISLDLPCVLPESRVHVLAGQNTNRVEVLEHGLCDHRTAAPVEIVEFFA